MSAKGMESIILTIRNVLRKEGISGMESINHCIAFIVCRMLNEELCKKVKMDTKYTYENMMTDDDGDMIGDQELFDKFYLKSKPDCFIGQLVNKLGFKNIKFKMESIQHVKEIMKKLKDFDPSTLSLKFDIIGTIYELHLKSGTSNAMRDLGQYYTNRQVIEYMIKLCDPKMNKKGIVETILDPSMGTGGFLTMSIKYLNDKYKKIDWEQNKDNIIGFDIDDNVRNMALLNILLETGELCNESLVKNDTLYNDLKFADGKILQKAKIILANEPMGLKNIIHASCCDRIKNLKIRGTKAEPLFLQLFMEALDDNGRCAVIVPDGVLYNDSTLHNETRKYLIDNFNLKKIIALSDDFFLNTGVKTSILFFTKTGKKTEEVEFSEIKLKNNEIDETSIITVNYDNIIKNKYSLFVNKYNILAIDKIEGIKYKKLNEILIKQSGKSLSKNNMKHGDIPVISGGVDFGGYHNEYNYDDELLFVARVGTAGYISKFTGKCYVTDLVGAYKILDETILFNYVYYYLKHTESQIKDNYVMKTGAPSINLGNFLNNYEIPIPSLTIQKLIVKKLDVLNNCVEQSKLMVDDYRKIIKYYIDCQTLCEKNDKIKNICVIMCSGIRLTENMRIVGIYPYYGSNGIICNVNEYKYTGDYILTAESGTIGSVHFTNGNFFPAKDLWILDVKEHNKKYVYYFLKYNGNIISYKTGIGIPHLSKKNLEDIPIKIPSKEKQNEIVKYCDNLSNLIEQIEQQINNNQELMKNIMDNYLNSQEIDETEQNVEQDTENNDIDTEIDKTTEDLNEKKPTKKKTTSIKKVEPEEQVQVEKKPTKKNSKTPVVEDVQEEIVADEYEWDINVLKIMKKYKEKNDENKKILTKLRKDNNIDTDTFWNKIKDLRKDCSVVQKTK